MEKVYRDLVLKAKNQAYSLKESLASLSSHIEESNYGNARKNIIKIQMRMDDLETLLDDIVYKKGIVGELITKEEQLAEALVDALVNKTKG